MDLAEFASHLFTSGQITLPGQLQGFTTEEEAHTITVLKEYHARDAVTMPANAPDFDEEAALWAAKFMYRSVQLLLLRDLGEADIEVHLKAYTGAITPAAIYSADLSLRHLQRLFGFASGLAPEDLLVKRLKLTAVQWPFSSVGTGIPIEELPDQLLAHPSLQIEYCDRIIAVHDTTRVKHPDVAALVGGALGSHIDYFWPELALISTLATDGNENYTG